LLVHLVLSLLVQTDEHPLSEVRESVSRTLGWQLSVLSIATAWVFSPVVTRMVAQWYNDANYSHGFFVPLFALFLVWEERGTLARLPKQPSWWGLTLLVFGLAVLTAGVVGAELFFSRISLLFVLAGVVVLFLGWNHLVALRFPLGFLILMIPIPQIIMNQITIPLQAVASASATAMLSQFGVPVLREGNILHLPAIDLGVAEACSGIRSLMALGTLSIIYGYLMDTRVWVRVALVLASIPIAVFANSLRIVGAGLVGEYWDPEKARGFFHEFSGLVVFAVSMVLLVFTHQLLRWIGKRTAERAEG
jgi:exosortase